MPHQQSNDTAPSPYMVIHSTIITISDFLYSVRQINTCITCRLNLKVICIDRYIWSGQFFMKIQNAE